MKKDSKFSRRDFIKGLGIAGGVALLGASAEAQTDERLYIGYRCKDVGATIRKNFRKLTAAELTAFKNGIAVMKARPLADPTSWAYQAAIHGTYNSPVQNAWNTCKHDPTFFLSWHRMYLCFFERILRKASGRPSLGLPYWNYSDTADPNARYLPSAFRTPANATNPLYVSQRNAGFNNGTAQLSASAVSLSSVLPGPTAFYSLSTTVQGSPHNVVHTSINGWMSDPATAGQDPIFWLHHCNIDRLWNRWLSGAGGRHNPTSSDTAWYNTNFTFYDEYGTQVQMKGADIIAATQSSCRSCYDEESYFSIWWLPNRSNLDILEDDGKYSEGIDKYIDVTLGIYEKPVVLEAARLTFDIELNEKAQEYFTQARKATAKPADELNFRLDFEDVNADKPMGFFYEVYLDLPEDVTEPNYKMDSYAGNLALFGANSHSMPMHHDEMETLKYRVNVTEAIKRSNAAGVGKISVTLVPTGLVSADESRLPIVSDVKVSIGQITFIVEKSEK
jgi:Common central domain of tyrosinase/Polyphenol oxidase middle domain